MMDAREVLERISAEQGWDQDSQLNLLLRFIQYQHDFAHGGADRLDFESWLANQAEWENEEGLDAGRAG